MKDNVKKFSLIISLIICSLAVILGVVLLNLNKNNEPLSLTVFYSETGEYSPGFTGGEIEIFVGEQKLDAPIQNNTITMPEGLNNSQLLILQAVPAEGFGFAGFYGSEDFSQNSLLSNLSTVTATADSGKVYAKFGKLVDVTFNVTTENPELNQTITTPQPLTKLLTNNDFLREVNQNCAAEITAFYSEKTAQLTENLGGG